MRKYTKQELDRMSIFDVRHIAKEVGVSAPTKLNKAELVDLIYKISNGLMLPPTPPKVGRPKKFNGTVNNVNAEQTEDTLNKPAQQMGQFKTDMNSMRRPINYRRPYDSTKMPERREPRYRSDNGYDRLPVSDEASEYQEFTGAQAFREDKEFNREGFLEINPDNYGFLRVKSGECCELDAYVSSSKIRQYGLRKGDYVVAVCRRGQDENKPAPVYDVISVNGDTVEAARNRPNFDTLTPIYPQDRLRLEVSNQPREYAMRCIDLVSPVGKGQRAIIVSPPKAGKTTLLKMIAGSISKNYPDVELKVLLIDERPEEVTDIKETVAGPNVEVIYSTFDELAEHHKRVSEMVVERAKRLVEHGQDVVILLDSITRLARAYNLVVPPSGRTLSGGLDPAALHMPKRFFGAARNMREGGSLTILATALVETGSKMDDVIYEEFKGTGNMELVLNRKLQEKRVFPAIDIPKSGTRREDLLLNREELEAVEIMRKGINGMKADEAVENILNMFDRTRNNIEFVQTIKKTKIF